MKKLNKEQQKQFDALCGKLEESESKLGNALEEYKERQQELFATLQGAVTEYNDEITALFEQTVEPAVDDYNETLEEVREFRDGITDEMQCYYDDRSEKWQEEKGSDYESWQSSWTDTDLEEISIDAPEPITVDDQADLDEPEYKFDAFSQLEIEVNL